MTCVCGCELSIHIPDAQRPFMWPCRGCGCSKYREVPEREKVFIADPTDGLTTMKFVRFYRMNNGRGVYTEGLMAR